jgi:hypothetical protein
VSIIRDYRENGIPIGNRLKFDPKDRPLVYKDIPMVDGQEVDNQNQLTKRLDDLSRIGQILASPAGQKYLSNESLLFASKVKPGKRRETGVGRALSVLSQGLFNAAKIVGSTLAQVPVNGTGTHFVKAFAGKGRGTYLHEIGFSNVVPHASSNGIDIISTIFGNPNALEDANSVAGRADITLFNEENSILFSAQKSKLAPKRTKEIISNKETLAGDSTRAFGNDLNDAISQVGLGKDGNATDQQKELEQGIAKYRYKEEPGDNPDTKDVVEKSGQVLNITDAAKAGKVAKLSISDYTGSSPLNTDTTQIVEHPKLPFDGEGKPKFKGIEKVPASTITRDNPSLGFRSDFNPKDTDKKEFDVSQRIGLGTPASKDLDDKGKKLSVDKINILAPQNSKLGGTKGKEGRDLIKFRFQIITPGGTGGPKIKHLYFRALIDNFGDTFNANWNSYNYIGRGESFYTYGNFDRSIDLGFKIAAQTEDEMKPLYQKLNYLIGATTPTYSQNFMRGTFVKMTVGDYIYELPGFLNNVNVSWNQEYPWEIAMTSVDPVTGVRESTNKRQELPMILDVGLSFTPIHTFLPEAGGSIEGDAKNPIIKAKPFITHGRENTNNIYITDPDIKDPNATNTN